MMPAASHRSARSSSVSKSIFTCGMNMPKSIGWSIRLRRRAELTEPRALAVPGVGRFVVVDHGRTCDDGRDVALGALDHPTTLRGEVLHDDRRAEPHLLEVDDVDVGLHPDLDL